MRQPLHSLSASCAVGLAVGGLALGIFALSISETWPHSISPLRAGSPPLAAGAADGLSAYIVQVHDAIPTAAQPQGWAYPWQCCSGLDCRQARAGEIGERADGYHTPSGEVIPMTDSRVRQSPDGAFHWCAHTAGPETGKTICLFVPGRGS